MKCQYCEELIDKFVTNRFDKVVERRFCTPCFRKERNKSKKKEKKEEKEGKDKVESSAISFLSGISDANSKPKKKRQLKFGTDEVEVASNGSPKNPERKSIVLGHHIFDSYMGWLERKADLHPTLKVNVRTVSQDYDDLNLPCPQIKSAETNSVTDSGAQSCLWGLDDFYRCG